PPEMIHHPSHAPTSTLTDATDSESLTFHSDSEMYDDVPETLPELRNDIRGGAKEVQHPNNVPDTKKSMASSKWGHGWGLGKKKEKEAESEGEKGPGSSTSQTSLPLYHPPASRSNAMSSHPTGSMQRSHSSNKTDTHVESRRRRLYPDDSSTTLVGSAFERKITEVDVIHEQHDTSDKLESIRCHMADYALDYYIVPSEDAHGSEYVAESDQRRQHISGFYGTAGQAIVTMSSAYLITDSRYWLQAKEQLDRNWTVVKAGGRGEPKDWIEWLIARAKDARIGIDARMISHENAMLINSKIIRTNSKLTHPPENLVDHVWKDKPRKSKAPIFKQPIEFSGVSAATKLLKLRDWIEAQPPAIPPHSKNPATPDEVHTGTLITSLSCISYLLNVRGSDIPHNPLFHAYLYVGLESATIFLDASKVTLDTGEYLKSLGVERREYLDIWSFLQRREWGKGKILISPQTSYEISRMLTHSRYTVAPSWIEHTMAVKNETELEGLRRAYLRDGASFVRFLAWLENKLTEGLEITEYEAASRLTQFRRHNSHFMGLAYKSISATGSNAALPHYSPRKSTARMIERETPYLNDSGVQYSDGTCNLTRTVHFGRPSPEQCAAFTRVLQSHIVIDGAIFPEGTPGHQLDLLARKPLWNLGHKHGTSTGHGYDTSVAIHGGRAGFSSSVALVPGHVIDNKSGFYNEGKWGMRVESALAVRRQRVGFPYGNIWLTFERLTCVPIQTRMVKESLLTHEEKAWLKVRSRHLLEMKPCLEKLTPLLKDDKQAMKWLRREAGRGIGSLLALVA
ncbi:Creatinase aminopeptidase, partial [Lyophyllum atratum]